MADGLHLLHVFPSFGRGGMELRLASIMNGLGAEWRHTVVALDGRFEASQALAPDVRVELVAAPPAGDLARPWMLRRLLAARRADLVITYNWGSTDAIIGSLLFPPSPMVHNECGFGVEEAEQLLPRRRLARRVLLRRPRRTIVVSETLRKLVLEQFRLPSRKVRLIRSGVDTGRFAPRRSPEWRQRLGIAPDAVVFGFAGVFRPEKNLPLLVRAFAQAALPEAVLALAGDGKLRPDVERLVRELGLESRVRFAGMLQDPAPFYAALDAFVLSSETEQTPVSLLEAMASGLPAVTTDVGDCALLLNARPGGGSVVPPRDTAALAQALGRLARDAGARRSEGAANRARAVAEFSRDRMIREYRATYLEAAAGR